jgi:hypothetical protein
VGGTFDRDLKRPPTKAGWGFQRQAKGSHELWTRPERPKPMAAPQGMVSRHTANEVLRRASLEKTF